MITLYRHTNTKNGKAYIGLTNKTVEARWAQHLQSARRGSKFAFHCAIRKYGENCWTSEVLCVAPCLEGAKILEAGFIATSPPGYNMTAGGDGFRGLQRSAEHRAAISRAHKGRIISEETKAKLRAYKGEKASFYGRKQSLEWRAMMKEVQKRLVRPKGAANSLAKEYIVTHPDGREELIAGLADFCRNNGIVAPQSMLRVASGNIDTCQGFKCRYAEKARAAEAEIVRNERHRRRSENWKAAAQKNRGPKKLTQEQIEDLRKVYNDGRGLYVGFWSHWSRHLGVSDVTVRNICLRLGAYKDTAPNNQAAA